MVPSPRTSPQSILGKKNYTGLFGNENIYFIFRRMQKEQKEPKRARSGHSFTSYFRGYCGLRECMVVTVLTSLFSAHSRTYTITVLFQPDIPL